MNLYYIMQNSKITVKLNMNSFKYDTNVKQFTEKAFDVSKFFREKLIMFGYLDDFFFER